MDYLVSKYAAGVDVRHFQNLAIYTREKTKFMMRRHRSFVRVRVEGPHQPPIDCMVYQIEPDVYWTRSLYGETQPQVFYTRNDAKQMMVSYVHAWRNTSNKQSTGQIMHDDDFFGCSPGRAVLWEDTPMENQGEDAEDGFENEDGLEGHPGRVWEDVWEERHH
jgi:hypothetical protein